MRKDVQFKPRFFVLLGLLVLAVLTGIFVLVFSRDRGEIKDGSQTLAMSVTGVVIRDERSISTEKYNRATYAVKEGERVFPESAIATVYKYGFNDEMTQSLASIRAQIYAMQMDILAGIEYPELTVMELSIKQKEAAIRECDMEGTGCLLTMENELKELLTQRSTYLRSAVQPTAELTALYEQEEVKMSQISSYATDVLATEEGVVSFYFDGYEEALNADKMETVNADLINTAAKGGTSETVTADETKLYRLINDTHWYYAFVTPVSQALRVVQGEKYTVTFEGYAENLYVGTALAPTIYDSGILNVIEFNISIDALINVRAAHATIGLEAAGLEVPIEAVTVKDGVAGVSIRESGETHRVEVDVLAADEETAIIRTRGETLYAGMKYEM